MNIKTVGHDAENAVLQIMQLFFAADSDAEVKSRLFKEDGRYVSEAEIKKDGEVSSGRAECGSSEKLYITNTIKKAVFSAAKKLSDMPAPWGISTGIRPAKTARKMLDEGVSESRIKSFLKEEYLMEEKKASLATEVAKSERRILSQIGENSVSIYVGIPFCPSRCSYCSFISQATEHNKKYILPYVDALIREIEYSAKILHRLGQKAETVYFGGGTPTAIETALLRRIIESVKGSFDLSRVKEFTVEAGRPDTISKEMMKMLKEEGVSRISINPQTMHQKTLDTIGRRHSVEEVKRAFYTAREEGMENINADIIVGLPGEDCAMVSQSADELLSLSPQSVTVHTLYMKRAARLNEEFSALRFARDTYKMMDTASEKLREKDMLPYYMYKQKNTLGNLENVGFAKEGYESIYNVCIMEEEQSILALGAGGSTKAVCGGKIQRIFNPKEAADYANRIEEVLRRKDEYEKIICGAI